MHTALARDLLMALDPVELAMATGVTPDPWQTHLLRSTEPRVLLNCCRQAGKSTMAATIAVHAAVFQPESLVLLLSPSLRQSQELFKKALKIYQMVDASAPSTTESALRLELANGSRIVSLPGKEETVRGFSGVKLLIVDEASLVSSSLYLLIRPMLAVSGGRLLALKYVQCYDVKLREVAPRVRVLGYNLLVSRPIDVARLPSSLTRERLIEVGRSLGIDVPSKAKKERQIAAIPDQDPGRVAVDAIEQFSAFTFAAGPAAAGACLQRGNRHPSGADEPAHQVSGRRVRRPGCSANFTERKLSFARWLSRQGLALR